MTPRELAWTSVVEACRCAMDSWLRLEIGAFSDRSFEERRICDSADEAAEWGRRAVARSLRGPLVPPCRRAV